MSQYPHRPIVAKGGKASKTKARTIKEHAHLGRVKELPCGVCRVAGPSDAHHILEGRIPGRKSPDWLAIPLCKSCHTGPHGAHGNWAMWEVYKANELQVLADTLEAIYG